VSSRVEYRSPYTRLFVDRRYSRVSRSSLHRSVFVIRAPEGRSPTFRRLFSLNSFEHPLVYTDLQLSVIQVCRGPSSRPTYQQGTMTTPTYSFFFLRYSDLRTPSFSLHSLHACSWKSSSSSQECRCGSTFCSIRPSPRSLTTLPSTSHALSLLLWCVALTTSLSHPVSARSLTI
jgi:hypothetical protein